MAAKKKQLNEVSPPGWSGTVKAMKKHKDIDNPFALAWSMKNKGEKPHYKPEKKNEAAIPTKEAAMPTTPPAPNPVSSLANKQQKQLSELEMTLQEIGRYNELGQTLRHGSKLRSVAEQLMNIAELAEKAVVNEADDWFDGYTVKRNMGEIKKYAGDFMKLATEADMMNQRMTALYDDCGRILERYFEIPDVIGSDSAGEQDKINLAKSHEEAPKSPTGAMSAPDLQPKLGESEVESQYNPQPDGTPDRAVAERKIHTVESPRPAGPPIRHKMDEVTKRVVKKVYESLAPEDARKFIALPKQQLIKAAYRLLK